MLPAPAMLFREKPTGDLREHGLGSLPPDSQNLLQARIKDLKLHLSGTPLEKHIHQLYAELDSKGLSLRPQCYLSDQWGRSEEHTSNSSHANISYAVFCLKKNKITRNSMRRKVRT